MSELRIPDAPSSIQKGVPLKLVLDIEAVQQLGANLQLVYSAFDKVSFVQSCMLDIDELSLTERSKHIAESLKTHLPDTYSEALSVILKSLTPPLARTHDNGLASMFYMPHCSFIAKYGCDSIHNRGVDPFELSINAQFELTQRFTCEFSIRPFIEKYEERTLEVLYQWMKHENPHVRRLCSEGTRPRLPWSSKLNSFVQDPSPCLPILEHLKNDEDLYVRRSVANHVGDIAKDNLDLALNLCDKWLLNASKELKWVIRHALRNPVKKGNDRAINIRKLAG
jgi:3-methyladenine DNA glycosylase AlkC